MMMIDINFRSLHPDTLDNLISEYVTRDGTDYGAIECDLQSKKQQLMQALDSGVAKLVYSPQTRTCEIIKA